MNDQGFSLDFLAGGGEMGALTRAYDWAGSRLGAPDTWPQSLRTIVRIVLNSRHPMLVWWGPDLVQFYNDAYRETMGPERHPSALGQPGRECWAEIWDVIGPQINYVLEGKGSTWNEDRLIPVTRHGRLEDVWWTYSFAPIDLEGRVEGILIICSDVTAQHLATQSVMDQSVRLNNLFRQAPSFMAVLRGPDHVFELTNTAYKLLIDDRDVIGKAVREAFPDVAGQGYFELLDKVFQTGKAHVGRRVPLTFRSSPDAEPKATFIDFVYQPITDTAGQVTGIFVEGADVTDHVHAENQLRLLNDELKHRVKNTISVVSAIASQTLRGKGQDAALDAFHARLMAFGRAHDILTATSRTTAPIGEVVNEALTPYRTGAGRFRISGPDILLGSQQALSLSLALHELATNAAKYGALTCEDGHINIVWRVEDVSGEPNFQFLWQEAGGPAVKAPRKTGFGSQLIKRVLAGDFGGKVELSYEPTGFVCLLSAPQAKCCPPTYSSENPRPDKS